MHLQNQNHLTPCSLEYIRYQHKLQMLYLNNIKPHIIKPWYLLLHSESQQFTQNKISNTMAIHNKTDKKQTLSLNS